MRVAVIGGGIAGLAAAYHLQTSGEPDLHVALFERNNHLGGDAITLVAPATGPGVDLGVMHVFPAAYPGILDFCARKGVSMREAPLAVTVHRGDEVLWRTGDTFPALTAVLAGVKAALGKGRRPTLAEVANEAGFTPQANPLLFSVMGAVTSVLLKSIHRPLDGAVMEMLPFESKPAYLAFAGGVRTMCIALADPLPDVRLGTPVVSLRGKVVNGEAFDEVIVALPPHAAEKAVSDPTPLEALALASFSHTHMGHVVHHRPEGVVPATMAATDDFAFFFDVENGAHTVAPFGTSEAVYVTSSHATAAAEAAVHHVHWDVGVWTPNGQRAARLVQAISGTPKAKGRHYAGAFTCFATPWAEAAFASGLRAAESVLGRPLGSFTPSVREFHAEMARSVRETSIETRPGAACLRET